LAAGSHDLLVSALLAGGARWVQLRYKQAGGAALLAAARSAAKLTRSAGACLIVNDRLDVALAAGADGVHLGGDDMPVSAARSISPPGFLIGRSTHSLQEAVDASSEPCDYVALGPIFPTGSKPDAHPVVGLETLALAARRVGKPLVAIGGIDAARLPAVLATGTASAAVMSAVMVPGDVERRMKGLLEIAASCGR
jgi:thiamine-phosphate diphosphorylase